MNPLKAKRLKLNNRSTLQLERSSAINSNTASATGVSSSPAVMAAHGPSSAASRAQRFTLIHLLALESLTVPMIQKKTGIPSEALTKHLEGIADRSGTGSDGVWSLARKRYKELDPWAFNYKPDDRTRVIDNAIHALDKLRLNPQDKLWQILLPPKERGKGKTLSKLSLFPTDHRALLGGLNSQNKSQPASPGFTMNADSSEQESVNGQRKQVKKPDLIANAKKRQAGKTKVEKPVKQEKLIEKPTAEPKASCKMSAVAEREANNRKRKIKSDDRVHLSDDESLAPDDKPPEIESARALSSQAHPLRPGDKWDDVRLSPAKKLRTDGVVSGKETDTSEGTSKKLSSKTDTSDDASSLSSKAAQKLPSQSIRRRSGKLQEASNSLTTGSSPNLTKSAITSPVPRTEGVSKPGASKGPKEDAKLAKPQLKSADATETEVVTSKTTEKAKASVTATKTERFASSTLGLAKRAADPSLTDTMKEAKRQKLSSSARTGPSVPSSSVTKTPPAASSSAPNKKRVPSGTGSIAKPTVQPLDKNAPSKQESTERSVENTTEAPRKKITPQNAALDHGKSQSVPSTKNRSGTEKNQVQPPPAGKRASLSKASESSDTSGTAANSAISSNGSISGSRASSGAAQKRKPQATSATETPLKPENTPSALSQKPRNDRTGLTHNTPTKPSSASVDVEKRSAEFASNQNTVATSSKPITEPPAMASPVSAPKNRSSLSTPTNVRGADYDGTDGPLSRRQTIEAYKKYHAYFNAYEQSYAAVKASPSEKITDTDIRQLEIQNAVLIKRKEPIIAGFSAIMNKAKTSLSFLPDELVKLNDSNVIVLSETDVEKARQRLSARWTEWSKRYVQFQNNVGVWKPSDVETLLEELDDISHEQKNIARAVTLEYGKKSEGNLEDVTMSTMTAERGRSDHNTGAS